LDLFCSEIEGSSNCWIVSHLSLHGCDVSTIIVVAITITILAFLSVASIVAMKPHEIQEKLGLTRIRDRNWYVQPSCATTGDGLYEGLTWLTSNIKT